MLISSTAKPKIREIVPSSARALTAMISRRGGDANLRLGLGRAGAGLPAAACSQPVPSRRYLKARHIVDRNAEEVVAARRAEPGEAAGESRLSDEHTECPGDLARILRTAALANFGADEGVEFRVIELLRPPCLVQQRTGPGRHSLWVDARSRARNATRVLRGWGFLTSQVPWQGGAGCARSWRAT